MSPHQMDSPASEQTLGALLNDLSHADPYVRSHARHALARSGSAAVASLLILLHNPSDALRWQAAKTLTLMHDPAAIDALISSLDDTEGPIRWLAAKGLIAIGPACVPPLLHTLITAGDDPWLFQGAHHILRALCDTTTKPVVAALEGSLCALEVPVAAYHALATLES